MFKKVVYFATAAVLAMALQEGVHAADIALPQYGAFAQIADGGTRATGSFITIITLVNLDATAAPYELDFIGDDGNPLSIATSAGTTSAITGTLAPLGSTIIQTSGATSAIIQGWATVTSNNTIAGSAVFRWTQPNGNVVEATVPLDTEFDYHFAIPFDQVTTTLGIALANPYPSDSVTVSYNFRDLSGNSILTDSFQMAPQTHTSYTLLGKYPQLAGKQGILEITADGDIFVIGLRAFTTTVGGTTINSLTTVMPLISYFWQTNF